MFAGIVPTWTGANMSPYGQVEGSKPSIGPHQAQQDPTDPTHAHDPVTGQNLYWDADKKTWVDSATGQEIGFDGVQTSNGTIIPGPPLFAGIVPTWTGANISPYGQMEGAKPSIGPHQARQDPSDPTNAFDSTTGQNLNWDPDNNTWVDVALPYPFVDKPADRDFGWDDHEEEHNARAGRRSAAAPHELTGGDDDADAVSVVAKKHDGNTITWYDEPGFDISAGTSPILTGFYYKARFRAIAESCMKVLRIEWDIDRYGKVTTQTMVEEQLAHGECFDPLAARSSGEFSSKMREPRAIDSMAKVGPL